MIDALEIAEYETRCLPVPLPARQVRDQLGSMLGPRLQLDWLADGQARVRSGSWVGVVRIPSGHTVRIVPKLAGDELQVLFLLGLVSGLTDQDLLRLQRSLSAAQGGDLLDLVCSLVIEETSALLARGPLRDYRATREDLPFVRGRLDVVDQATRHFSRVDVLTCRYEAFDHDVLENRVLREAVSRAAIVTSDHKLRRRARQLHEELSLMAPGRCPPVARVVQQLQYDRRNEGYRTAHAWALVLLGGESIVRPFDDVGHASPTFLINMNRLFEQFVAWLFTRAYAGSGIEVREQARDRSLLWRGDARWGDVVPDILLRQGKQRLAVDAKYKRYDLKRVSPEDLYQLFLYAQAYGGFGDAATAVLVHPVEAPAKSDRIDLRLGGSTKGSVITLPLHLPRLLHQLKASSGNDQPVLEEFREQVASVLPLLNPLEAVDRAR